MGSESFLNFEKKKVTENKDERTMSHLYNQMVRGKLTFSEEVLICKILKHIATLEDIVIPNVVVSEKLFVDLTKKESAENFVKTID
jgi:hypothetical protein